MNRRRFLPLTVTAAVGAAAGYYAWEEVEAATTRPYREIAQQRPLFQLPTKARQILYLASLAPSGHNAQPWTVRLLSPWHWVIGTDPQRWLPVVDASQRETLLSLGAFVQNLEYAAAHFGYLCRWQLRATTPQDREVLEVELTPQPGPHYADVATLLTRRTLRIPFGYVPLSPTDVRYLTEGDTTHWCYVPPASTEGIYLRTATLAATQQQTRRDDAQRELAHWVRWRPADVQRYRDGLTAASMSINGLTGWAVRHFYDSAKVLTPAFRQRSLTRATELAAAHGGWLVLSDDGNSVASLLDAGRRLERLWLKARAHYVAVQPMSQVLEEAPGPTALAHHLGLSQPVQMVLRVGYVDNYPAPVSVRRPVEWFARA